MRIMDYLLLIHSTCWERDKEGNVSSLIHKFNHPPWFTDTETSFQDTITRANVHGAT